MNFIANLLTIQPVKELYLSKLIKKRRLKNLPMMIVGEGAWPRGLPLDPPLMATVI